MQLKLEQLLNNLLLATCATPNSSLTSTKAPCHCNLTFVFISDRSSRERTSFSLNGRKRNRPANLLPRNRNYSLGNRRKQNRLVLRWPPLNALRIQSRMWQKYPAKSVLFPLGDIPKIFKRLKAVEMNLPRCVFYRFKYANKSSCPLIHFSNLFNFNFSDTVFPPWSIIVVLASLRI